jgi:catechol 2,3-dioxygenase-like lactoylglutathione lyase family enzyme
VAVAVAEGVGLGAVEVDGELQLERRRGMAQVDDQGKTLARFFFATDPDGYKIEVIQKGGRFA